MNNNIIPRRIIDLREKKDWSQTKLAQQVGISKSIMSKIENGSRKITAEELIVLANIFEVTSDYLLGLSDYPYEVHATKTYDLEILLSSSVDLKYAKDYLISEEEKKFFNDIISGHYTLKEQNPKKDKEA